MTGQKLLKLTWRNSGVWNWIFGGIFLSGAVRGTFLVVKSCKLPQKIPRGETNGRSVLSFESRGASACAWQFDRWTQELERLRPDQKWGQLKKNSFFLETNFWMEILFTKWPSVHSICSQWKTQRVRATQKLLQILSWRWNDPTNRHRPFLLGRF